jgi:hypothetical protein
MNIWYGGKDKKILETTSFENQFSIGNLGLSGIIQEEDQKPYITVDSANLIGF